MVDIILKVNRYTVDYFINIWNQNALFNDILSKEKDSKEIFVFWCDSSLGKEIIEYQCRFGTCLGSSIIYELEKDEINYFLVAEYTGLSHGIASFQASLIDYQLFLKKLGCLKHWSDKNVR